MYLFSESIYELIIWISVAVFLIVYCCVCFLFCRRESSKNSVSNSRSHIINHEGPTPTATIPRRYVKVHLEKTPGHACCQDYPVLGTMPCVSHGPSTSSSVSTVSSLLNLHRPHVVEVSVIDPQTKLSFNPNFIAEEPPPSYNALFP